MGALLDAMREYDRQLAAAGRHAAAEGVEPTPDTVLNSYDRALHPWLHGRRPHDLARNAAAWWRSLTDR